MAAYPAKGASLNALYVGRCTWYLKQGPWPAWSTATWGPVARAAAGTLYAVYPDWPALREMATAWYVSTALGWPLAWTFRPVVCQAHLHGTW